MSNEPPASLAALTQISVTGQVGTPVPGGVAVKVLDASGRPVRGASVAFTVTIGNGTISPVIAVSDSKGQAASAWTLGTIVGANALAATVSGVSTPINFVAAAKAGPVASFTISPPSAHLLPAADSVQLTVKSLDAFGNATTPPPTFAPRDPTLISVDSTGLVRALRRGSSTYVIVSAGTRTDSVLVTVLAPGQSVCTGSATPTDLAVGQVVTGIDGSGACIHASSDSAEYAIVPYFDSPAPGSTIQLEVRGQGLGVYPSLSTTIFATQRATALRRPQPSSTPVVPDDDFEARLRQRERTQLKPLITGQQAAFRARREASLATTTTVPAVGSFMTFNVNSSDMCTNPDNRTGRVVAVTNKAIVVADTADPAGGFTDAEYGSIGVTFDTLVDPVDEGAFGAPTDIDNNGHVILFFTRAVNELTPSNSSTVVLGFFIQRDLLPKTGAPGPCASSNAGEMFYLLVPDTAGMVNSNIRPKDQVVSFTNGTVAHEYQHLINASRRLYVNGAGTNFEERWLDEGLAHVAEELNFYKSAQRQRRQNFDITALNDPVFAQAYATFGLNNVRRYETYLGSTETQGPIGVNSFDDDLPTRGAIWSFLRYCADHLPVGNENSFWFNLVNTTTTGVANLTHALGAPPDSIMRDWAISVYMDDNAPNVDPRFEQPSWNMRSIVTGGFAADPYSLTTRTLRDGGTTTLTLLANSVSFLQFTVPVGQDAILAVTSNNAALPSTVQLAIVRIH